MPDLNLLVALDALLAEGSVVRAARKLRLSQSAMSRTLARLRRATGDPLLVRAGRGLAPTPHALDLRGRTGRLVEEAEAALRPAGRLDLQRLDRTFALRSREGFIENVGPSIIARVRAEAPGIRLRFLLKTDRDHAALRDGAIDLETAVVDARLHPELRSAVLFTDRYVGVASRRHALGQGRITPSRFAACGHVCVSGHGLDSDPVDDALAAAGLARTVVACVGGYAAGLALVRASDLVICVPERHSGSLRSGLLTFPLPVPVPGITISLLWHQRSEADPAHRWLRDLVISSCPAG